MKQTLARIRAELKAMIKVNKFDSWEEQSKIMQLAHIEAIDSRVLTMEEKQYIKDFQNGDLK